MQKQENSLSETQREVVCERCQTKFIQTGAKLWSRIVWPWSSLCEECQKIDQERQETEREEAALERHEHRWASEIPWLYRDTNRAMLRPSLVETIERFNFQGSKGLYLSGEFGAGKTRGLTLILRRCHDDGKSIMFLNSVEMGRIFADRYHSEKSRRNKAEHTIDRCGTVNVLMIDDLGKERATDRFETEFYSILEERTTNQRPMLISSNYEIDDLAARFSSDQGGAIMRRIVQFCHVSAL